MGALKVSKIVYDLEPLKDAITASGLDYKTVSIKCGIAFPKVLALMNGNSKKPSAGRRPIIYGNELVRLAFFFNVPLSEFVEAEGNPRDSRNEGDLKD